MLPWDGLGPQAHASPRARRYYPSTPPPDGFSFLIHKIIERAHTRSIAVHTAYSVSKYLNQGKQAGESRVARRAHTKNTGIRNDTAPVHPKIMSTFETWCMHPCSRGRPHARFRASRVLPAGHHAATHAIEHPGGLT